MESVRHRRAIICAALAVILIAGLLYRVARWKENDTLTIQESGENLAESSEHSRDEDDQVAEEPATVAVHVSGAVAHPDRVYLLAVGSRIQDAIEVAGGAAEDADLTQLNLAQRSQMARRSTCRGRGRKCGKFRQMLKKLEKINKNP